MLEAGVLPAFHDGNHRWLLPFFPRLESAAGRKRRGPAKPAPQSIPSPLVRRLRGSLRRQYFAPRPGLLATVPASPDILLRNVCNRRAPAQDATLACASD